MFSEIKQSKAEIRIKNKKPSHLLLKPTSAMPLHHALNPHPSLLKAIYPGIYTGINRKARMFAHMFAAE